MLREYLFCLQSLNLLSSLLCSFVGQKKSLGLIFPLGMQSRSSHRHDPMFSSAFQWLHPASLGDVAADLSEGPGMDWCKQKYLQPCSCAGVSCKRTLHHVAEAGSCWCWHATAALQGGKSHLHAYLGSKESCKCKAFINGYVTGKRSELGSYSYLIPPACVLGCSTSCQSGASCVDLVIVSHPSLHILFLLITRPTGITVPNSISMYFLWKERRKRHPNMLFAVFSTEQQ